MSTPPKIRTPIAIEPPIIKMYQESRFRMGKAKSRAPIMSGIRKLPSTAGIDGIRKKKIMTTPWIVNRRL